MSVIYVFYYFQFYNCFVIWFIFFFFFFFFLLNIFRIQKSGSVNDIRRQSHKFITWLFDCIFNLLLWFLYIYICIFIYTFTYIPNLKWSVFRCVPSYSNISKKCLLCLYEQLEIVTYQNQKELLKNKSELLCKCPHANKLLLKNYTCNDSR